MGAAIEIREATTEDLETIVTLWIDLVSDQRKHGSHILAAENESPARETLSRYIVMNDVVVAEATEPATAWNAGDVLGFVMFHVEEGLYEMNVRRGIVENVYVLPAARDREIGSALMDHAEKVLADEGAEVIALSVMAANERGIDFYRERGYEPQRIVLERSTAEEPPD